MPSADPTAMFAALRTDDRLAALECALDAYFGPAVLPKPAGLPAPLAALFTRFAPGLLRQNHLAMPDRKSPVFYVENQSCNHWALADASDDPPVVRDGSVVENEPLSGFAIQLVLFEASMGALDWQAGGFMDARDRTPVLSGVGEVPLLPWTWPNNARFYVAPGVVAHIDGVAEDETWVFASARSEAHLLDLARRNGIEWTAIGSAGKSG